MGRRETAYQKELMNKLEGIFPGCTLIRHSPYMKQGMPDLIILWGPNWAALEVKDSANAPVRPNQPYYIDKFDEQSFGAFIYPENEEEVLDALQSTFGIARPARFS